MGKAVPVVAGVVCVVLFAACGGGGQPSGQPTAAAAKKTWTREEFRDLLMGKTEAEVVQAVGRPDSTSETGNTKMYIYPNVTVDPATGKTGNNAYVHFNADGKVRAVNY